MPILQLLRVQNFPSALADVWAGYFLHLARGGPLVLGEFVLLSLASLQIYGAGMALNDFVDYARDLLLHPHRPLPSGRLRQGDALILAALLLCGGGLCTMLIAAAPAAVCFILVVLVLSYDLWAKSHRWLGSLHMGLLRAGNLLLGLSPSFGGHGPEPWAFGALVAAHVFLLTLLSTYEGDRFAAGPVRLVFAGQLGVLALAVAVLPAATHAPWLAAALLLWLLQLGARELARSTTQAIPRMVTAGIRGLIVLDAAFVLAQNEVALGLLVLSLLLPSVALGVIFRGS